MKKFTLVEILVVIAVIGILASLILPAVTGANQQTMRLKAKADVSNIMSAIVKYESTYGKLPALMKMDGSGPNEDYFAKDELKNAGKLGRLSKEGYYALIQSLSGVDIAKAEKEEDKIIDDGYTEINDTDSPNDWQKGARAMNPRKTPFLDVPQDFPKNGFVDPWGNEYIIILDYEINPPHDEYESTNIKVSAYDKIIEHPALSANKGNAIDGITANDGFLKLAGSDENTNIPAVVRANVLVYSKGANGEDDGGLGMDVAETNSFDDISSWSGLQ